MTVYHAHAGVVVQTRCGMGTTCLSFSETPSLFRHLRLVRSAPAVVFPDVVTKYLVLPSTQLTAAILKSIDPSENVETIDEESPRPSNGFSASDLMEDGLVVFWTAPMIRVPL